MESSNGLARNAYGFVGAPLMNWRTMRGPQIFCNTFDHDREHDGQV